MNFNKYIFIFLFLLVIINLNAAEISHIITTNSSYLIGVVKNFFTNNFSANTINFSTIFLTSSTSHQNYYIQDIILQILNYNQNLYNYTLIISDVMQKINVTYLNYYNVNTFVVLVDDYLHIEYALNQCKTLPFYNNISNVIIIFIQSMLLLSPLNFDIVKKTFTENLSSNINIINLNILLIDSASNDLRVKIINESFSLINEQENSLKISACIWEPYVYYNDSLNVFDKQNLLGTEMLLMQTISDKLNIKLLYTFLNVTQHTFENENFSEFYSNLMLRKSDVMIGGLDRNVYIHDLLTSTVPYFEDDVTWCIQKANLKSIFDNFFDILSDELYFLFIVYTTLPSILIYYMMKKDGIIRHWTYSLALSFQWEGPYTAEYLPKNCISRCISLIFILNGLVLQAIFCCVWLNSITILRYEKQVNSMNAIRYYNLSGEKYAYEYFKLLPIAYSSTKYENCKNVDICLCDLENHNRLAVAVSRKHIMNKQKIYCLDKSQNIYNFQVAMITRKNFHLLNKFNNLIYQLIETGIINKWELESGLLYNHKTIELSKEYSDEPVVLELAHFYGIMSLYYGVVVSTSILCIILENYLFNTIRKLNTNKLIKLLEKTINPTNI